MARRRATTTDAPFRETRQAIEAMRAKGLDAVEMEAASMGQIEGDFEKARTTERMRHWH